MKYPAMHWIQIRRDEEWIDFLSCPAENVSEHVSRLTLAPDEAATDQPKEKP